MGRDAVGRRRLWALVVEHDDDARRLLAGQLADLGCAGVVVDSGATALEALGAFVPDVIVLAARVPGADAAAFRREQVGRGLAPGVPVVLLPAGTDDPPPAWTGPVPAAVLAGPIGPAELDAALRAAVP